MGNQYQLWAEDIPTSCVGEKVSLATDDELPKNLTECQWGHLEIFSHWRYPGLLLFGEGVMGGQVTFIFLLCARARVGLSHLEYSKKKNVAQMH